MEHNRYPYIGSWGKKETPSGKCIVCDEDHADCTVNIMVGWQGSRLDGRSITKPYDICAHCYVNTDAEHVIVRAEMRDKALAAPEMMTDFEYVASGGLKCPRCRYDFLEADGHIEANADGATQEVHCSNCGLVLFDQYKLTGYSI